MDERLKILLNKGRSETYINKNVNVNLNMENIARPLPLNDIDTTISAYEQFQKERRESTTYRFYGILSPIISNCLYNDNVNIYRDETGNITSKKIIADEIVEDKGWFGFYEDEKKDDEVVVGSYTGTYGGKNNSSSFQNKLVLSPGQDINSLYVGQPIVISYNVWSAPFSIGPNSVTLSFAIPPQQSITLFIDSINISTNTIVVNDWNDILFNAMDHKPNAYISFNVTSTGGNNTFNDNESDLCEFSPFDPGPDRLSFLDSDNIPNYLMKITYPATTINDVEIVNNVPLSSGIPVIEKIPIEINGRTLTGLRTPLNHGLSPKDTVIFSSITLNNISKNTFSVYRLGTLDKKNKERVFIIDENPDNITLSPTTSFKKLKNGYLSEYYIRVFSAITDTYLDYDMYPAAFGTTIYEDKSVAYNFKMDVDVGELRDNLGRPLSELFLTIVKNNSDASLNDIRTQYWIEKQQSKNLPTDFWTPIKSGFKIGSRKDDRVNYNIKSVNDDKTCPQQIYFDNIDESDLSFMGDIVEYNEYTLLENILENSYHWINTTYRQNYEMFADPIPFGKELNSNDPELLIPPNKFEGFVYKPHNRIVIKEYSSYIETGIANEIYNVPDYATDVYSTSPTLTGGTTDIEKSIIHTKRWRDLLDIGFQDITGKNVNYPFESGAHYIYLNTRFYFERQDSPCNYNIISTELELPPEQDIMYQLLSEPTYLDYSILNQELFDNLNTDDVTDLGAYSFNDEVKYAYERPPRHACFSTFIQVNFKTELNRVTNSETLYKPSGVAETRICPAITGKFIRNKGGFNQNFVDESGWYCEADLAWDEVSNSNTDFFDNCDDLTSSSLNVGFGSGKISNFCLAASGLGDITLKKTKDTGATCLRYLEVDVRNVDYYGDYELGQVDTPGDCIEFNFGDETPLEDDC
jgi:hypothetical protein